ncbi:transposase [Longirhabdus pacifica]|uniref:transposase n=1 Tax=Longirhabdus pacifica TaxID=2305227 RepID=UPI001008CCDE|nr:transposase [Longirhabdus pacifica]
MGKKHYEKSFKEKLVLMHLKDGRTINSLTKEYQLGQGSLNLWIKQYRKECENQPSSHDSNNSALFDELAALRKKTEELEKENRFLKKAAAFFAKETGN